MTRHSSSLGMKLLKSTRWDCCTEHPLFFTTFGLHDLQLYHSIHAKGENVEEILQEAEAAELVEDEEASYEQPVEMEDAEADAPTTSGDMPNRISTNNGAQDIQTQMDEPEVCHRNPLHHGLLLTPIKSTTLPAQEAGEGSYVPNTTTGQSFNIPNAALGEGEILP
jgi:hypothetical protein